MLYRDNNTNIRDTWAGISTNNATSFASGFAVDNNNWMLMSCPASGPDGVIIGDTLYSTFMNGMGGNYRTYLSKSSISTGAVNTVSNLTGPITGLGQQNYPRIATDGTAMAIVWRQIVSTVVQLPILFTNDIANGFTAAYDTVDVINITNTDVAMSNGNIFVVWQDDASGTVKYRSGTYTQVNAGIKEITETNFTVYPNPVSTTITLQSNIDIQNAEIKIFNLLGELVLTQSKNRNATVDVETLTNGIYFYK